MLLTIKQLSVWLNIKPCTLYAWAAQGKIPCRKIYGLVRFEKSAIEKWLGSFVTAQPNPISVPSARHDVTDVDVLIAAAKRDVYTAARGNQTNSEP
jgi:excisionase family DNA binding protein